MSRSEDVAVMDSQTAVMLEGECSAELAAASLAAGPEGMVPARLDADGVWQYVAPSMVSLYRDHRGVTVRTVYVERI